MNAEDAGTATRLDKWLWRARFCKSRARARELVVNGRVRVNRAVVAKAAQTVRLGDVLTFASGPAIRVVRITGLGHRRGPPAEARALYDDLAPPARREGGAVEQRAG